MQTTAKHADVFENFGLSAVRFEVEEDVGRSSAHTHLEVEMLFVERGQMCMDVGGGTHWVAGGDLVAYWGGLPHSVLAIKKGTTFAVAQIPIGQVLIGMRAAAVYERLMSGEVLRPPMDPQQRDLDKRMFSRWAAEMGSDGTPVLGAVRLEMLARLLRMIMDNSQGPPRESHTARSSARTAGNAVAFITRHFHEPISVGEIASAVERTSDHLMATFKESTGLTVWDYVTRLRVGEAQRLLIETDLSILSIEHRSGFASTSRMYAAFRRYAGQTPGEYRRDNR